MKNRPGGGGGSAVTTNIARRTPHRRAGEIRNTHPGRSVCDDVPPAARW